MGLSCSCNFGEVDETCSWYWEADSGLRRGSETKCCECNAPLLDVDRYETPLLIIFAEQTFAGFITQRFMEEHEEKEYEIEEHDGCAPYGLPVPIDIDDPELELFEEQAQDFIEDFIDAFCEETGWHMGEYYRFEKSGTVYLRCERCAGVAKAIGDVGYCSPIMEELVETHTEYTEIENGCRPVVWVADENGVLNPKLK